MKGVPEVESNSTRVGDVTSKTHPSLRLWRSTPFPREIYLLTSFSKAQEYPFDFAQGKLPHTYFLRKNAGMSNSSESADIVDGGVGLSSSSSCFTSGGYKERSLSCSIVDFFSRSFEGDSCPGR